MQAEVLTGIETAFDLIGDLAFGQDFGCMAKGKAAPFVAAIPSGARELTVNQMLKYYQLLPVAQLLKLIWNKIPSWATGPSVGAREENMRRAVEVVRARTSRGPTADRKDFWVWPSKYSRGHCRYHEGSTCKRVDLEVCHD